MKNLGQTDKKISKIKKNISDLNHVWDDNIE